MEIEIIPVDEIEIEELLKAISSNMKNLNSLKAMMEESGFMSADRWNMFNAVADELKKSHKEVKSIMSESKSYSNRNRIG